SVQVLEAAVAGRDTVEALEAAEARMERERGSGVEVGADGRWAQVRRCEAEAAAAGVSRGFVRVAQRSRRPVRDRDDGVEAVVAAVEEERDEISGADRVRHCAPHEGRAEEARA